MNNAEMKITRFDAADVIATSGCNWLSADWAGFSLKATDTSTLEDNFENIFTMYIKPANAQCYVNGNATSGENGSDVFVPDNYYHYNSADFFGPIDIDGTTFTYTATHFWLCTNDDHKQ